MHVEVDQSGKIGKTNIPTVLCFSNGIHYSLYISATDKQKCIRKLRGNGLMGESIYLRLFATLLFILLKSFIKNIKKVYIDIEYPGKNIQVKEYILNLALKNNIKIDSSIIQFVRVGKKAMCHKIALEVYRKNKLPDRRINYKDLLKEF